MVHFCVYIPAHVLATNASTAVFPASPTNRRPGRACAKESISEERLPICIFQYVAKAEKTDFYKNA